MSMRRMSVWFLPVGLVLSLSPMHLATADSGPPSSPTEPAPPSGTPGLAPPAPPPQIDPGILKQPEHLPPPAPEAVVPPPVVDPGMVVDPEGRSRPAPPPPPPTGEPPSTVR